MQIVCACSEIIAKSDNGTTKIRSKILLVKSDGTYAVCKGCGMEVPVPLTPTQAGPPLILRR